MGVCEICYTNNVEKAVAGLQGQGCCVGIVLRLGGQGDGKACDCARVAKVGKGGI